MAGILDTAKFVWDIIKDGAKLDVSDRTVSALPAGKSKADLTGWTGPVSFSEQFEEVSTWFGSDLANLTLTANWEYNGQYIANFNVIVDGSVDVLSNVDVTATTLEASLNTDDVVEMQYRIAVVFKNLTGGTKRRTYTALARGDGTGESLGIAPG
jgi:hypothetical protein